MGLIRDRQGNYKLTGSTTERDVLAAAEGILQAKLERLGSIGLLVSVREIGGEPNFASENKAEGTEAEFKDAMLRNSVHYGNVALVPSEHHIIFDVERSVYPNWEGKKQVRNYTLEGNQLSYEVPASSTGDGTVAISQWHRISPSSIEK